MKHKKSSAFKQFSKDCPKHLSEDVLLHAHMIGDNFQIPSKREKSTRTSKNVQKY